MRLNDPRVDEILQWWRKQPFWNKCLIALFHFNEWMSVTSLDWADKKASRELKERVFEKN